QTVSWLPAGSFISDKTYLLGFDDPEGTFEITLFCNSDEMAVWGPAAGNLNIIKSDVAIDEAAGPGCFIQTDLTRTVFGPTHSPATYYAFKGTFKGGAGFALTSASVVTTRNAATPSATDAIRIYPMPTPDAFRIDGLNSATYRVSLFALSGEMVLDKRADASHEISVRHLEKGVYFAKITTEDGRVYQAKLIKA
ncbi:MAG: T9SS type A sorting domain-containing protein, partial [Saprospiraceae bacterium]|nr:T9SS type A sorting domain-containing protein [Saprospiraceae bacterium]